MSLEQARSVIWPFRELKGQPIGQLMDQNLLSFQDLGFAIDRAYNQNVREAAKVVLLDALRHVSDRVETSFGMLNVITSDRRSFAERRQLLLFLIQGTILGITLGLAIGLLAAQLFDPPTRSQPREETLALLNQPVFVVALIIVILGIIGVYAAFFWLLNQLMNVLERRIQHYRKGQLGEDHVLNILYQVLDGRWWLLRHLELAGQSGGDIDMVLVGPAGVWSLEIKNWEGNYRTVGERWERQVGKKWQPTRKNPTVQAKRNAAKIAHLLKTHHIAQWVQPVVIWANPASQLTVENSAIFVWQLREVAEALKQLNAKSPMPDQKIADVIERLKRQYQTPFVSENL